MSGWSGQNQAQRELEVAVELCPGELEVFVDTICVRKREDHTRGRLSSARNWLDGKMDKHLNKIFNRFRNNRNAGSLLTCSMEGRVGGKRLLVGVGVGDHDVNGVFSFKRVSPHVEELNEVMIVEGDHHAHQEGVSQWKQQSWLAHVYAKFNEDEPLNHVCEGVFLSRDAVLTAASCLHDANGHYAHETIVRYGYDDMENFDGNRHRRSVIGHRFPQNDGGHSFDFDEKYDFHNLAVLSLEPAVGSQREWFDRHFKTPPVYNCGDARTARGCQVAGFEDGTRQIKFHRLKIKDTEKCISPILRPDTIQKFYNHHWCAHETTSRDNILPGSPLTCVDDDGNIVFYGIASYNKYMRINRHKTYTNVNAYKNSIDRFLDNQNDDSDPASSESSVFDRSAGSRSPVSGPHCRNRDEDCQIVGSNRPFVNGDSQDYDVFED